MTPAALKKRKLTLREATDQWCETSAAIKVLEARRDEAADVIKAHTEKTGKRTFFDRIAVERSGGSWILDQPAVTEFLGARVSEFKKQTKLGWTLKLLK